MSHGCGRQTLNDKINMQTETNDGNDKEQQTLAPAGLLGARPITPEDVIKEADRNYDLGRKHGHDEKADLLDWAETLLCNSLPMSHCTQEEWNRIIKSWRDQKHGASAPNDKLSHGDESKQ